MYRSAIGSATSKKNALAVAFSASCNLGQEFEIGRQRICREVLAMVGHVYSYFGDARDDFDCVSRRKLRQTHAERESSAAATVFSSPAESADNNGQQRRST